ncbi:MAG TPA: helix-turn-helix transcriptional regulator [Flavobacteriales bacterium]|nr:helix-turn-helix transcriptional regulator [Flavobacteriales bacterium]HMR28174.1 helix-turn-helix transcriptional regulator [Flavobacteriales bacterium]
MERTLPTPSARPTAVNRRVVIAVIDLADGEPEGPMVRNGHMITLDGAMPVEGLIAGLLNRPPCVPMHPGVERVQVQVMRHEARQEVRLSPREHQVLQALVAGLSYKMIADRLGIGFQTVSTHLRHIYTKLGVRTNTEAVAMALRCGMLAERA